jgi:dihydrofolate reductase
MGRVLLDMAMSLDGFIGTENNEDAGLHNWYFSEEENNNRMVVNELVTGLGAIIMGRRTYGTGNDQDGFEENPYTATNFVLTHHPPGKQPKGNTPFVFVTDGIESALKQAKAAAGERDVAIGGGANVAQQYLNAGLVDDVQIHLVHILLGKGLRLFEVGAEPIRLEKTRVIEAPEVTHLYFRVVK